MAMDLSRAVQWWEEWQLRILVLGSLLLQLVLFVASMVRNVRMPCLCRSCIWLAYLGADALAIYALATLFNRHTPAAAGSNGGGVLEVMWVPFLLVHLGGQHTFTAYSIEDNELWRRHVVTLVSQVTVALYVFCKSWPRGGDKRLLQAAVLLFIVGILKFIRKPWVIKAASINTVMTSSAIFPARRKGLLQDCCEQLCLPFQTVFDSFKDAAAMKEEEEHDLSLEQYVQEAKKLVQVEATDVVVEHKAGSSDDTEKLFVDLSAPYSHRLRNLKYFLRLERPAAYEYLKGDLSFAFGLIYTNFKGVLSCPGLLLQLLLPSLALASAVLFAKRRHKDDYEENDIKVTIILFCCTTLLEILPSVLCPCFLGYIMWSNRVAQHNLISFYTRESKPTMLIKMSAIIGCAGYINKHWFIKQAPESDCLEIIGVVTGHVNDGWKQYIADAPSYKRFNNFRGQWTVRRHKVSSPQLWWSLQVPFDRSVVVWHVATELCLHHLNTSPEVAAKLPAARRSKVISNYMIYLLFIRPEMLMPGTRQGLFLAACDDIKLMLKNDTESRSKSCDERTIARRILQTTQSPPRGVGTMIPGACKLAEDLMQLIDDEEERWKVIQGVWVEMLCCSASRCRGYLHAKSMGEGVEFLTYVWLLLSRMGMETLADKFQRPEPGEGEEIAAGTSASEPQGMHALEENAIRDEIACEGGSDAAAPSTSEVPSTTAPPAFEVSIAVDK